MKTYKTESGRSMIEMLGVLAIIGVLSVGGIAGYSKAMMKYRTNKTIEQISMIVTNVRTLFGSQKNYKALGATTNGSLIARAKLFPDELISGETIADNPFGGAIQLVAGSRNSDDATNTCTGCGDAKAFVLAYGNIPEEACMDLATQDWGSASGSGLIMAQIFSDVEGVCEGADTGDSGDTTPDNVEGNSARQSGAATCTALASKVADFAKKQDCATTTNGVACGGKGPMSASSAAAICADDKNALLLKFY